ncbi:HAMP domain-containing histidine kinase [Gluconacetobacter takamatsuzukensis]|uniref:histidine kinase n=2 Tax=Gluconacetobacter takamatsuzukensis TaxID=1286190 RepID=A0A7W4KFN8_9PROT|nr:HAMP domain-containing histidine kinase [Gluconacetobacter takamatsuzukensis]
MLITVLTGFHNQHLFERQIRRAITNEGKETLAAAGQPDVAHFLPVVKALVRNEPGFFYLLQDRSESVVAGNMLHLRPVTGLRWLSWAHRIPRDTHQVTIYGEGYQLSDGGYYFVGIDASQLTQLRHDLWNTVAWSFLGFMILGLAGGMLLSNAVLKRIESISMTARSIMRGNIARRIPLRGTGDEFDHLSQSLNAMLGQNETLIVSLRQVSNDIAHDMRSPLSRLRHRLERAKDREDTVDALKEQIDLSIDELDKALEIFASLLDLAQIEARTQSDEFCTVDLVVLVTEMAEIYQPIVEDHRQVLRVRHPPEAIVTGQPVLLRQMLANLVENAIHHTPSGSTITIEIAIGKGVVQLVVCDNGGGIPAGDLERVFDRFVRLDNSRSEVGNGLGLSMVRAIVHLHAGTITLNDNRPGLRSLIVLPCENRARILADQSSGS